MKKEPDIKTGIVNPFRTLFLLMLLIFFTGLPKFGIAQQVSPTAICTAGESFVTTTQSLEFVLGEVAVETFQTGGNILSQGFLQGTQKGIGIKEDLMKSSCIRVFPNPSIGVFTVSCENTPEKILVLDVHGKTIYKVEKPKKTVTVDIKELQGGIYPIRIIFKNNLPVTKRIIKN